MRRRCCIKVGVGLLLFLSFPAGARANDFEEARGRLERILRENIDPFWFPGVIDSEHGGYRLNHDASGQWQGHAPKGIVTQARTVWYFSRLVRDGFGTPEHLAAARHGFEFLRDKLWDRQFGGFFWSVDCTGDVPLMPGKHLYGQAFGLYALAEYFLATGDRQALSMADDLFGLMQRWAHDRRWGGYREQFQRDWAPVEDDSPGYMGLASNLKLMNTHLHLMEAMTSYVLAGQNPVAREALLELITIESNAVVRKRVGACTDRYRRDWTPLEGPSADVVSYGHDVENIWLLMDACRVAGISDGPLRDLYVTLFGNAQQYGYDAANGGFFSTGPFRGPATDRTKVWWVQAEALVAALRMFELTGERAYYQVFERTLAWVVNRQVDWKHGDWHANVGESGETGGEKAGLWKAPYHNARAMFECLAILGRLGRQ